MRRRNTIEDKRRFVDAININDLQVVSRMIRDGIDTNIELNHDLNPLHLASIKGHLEIAKILIDSNPRLLEERSQGLTHLHLASKNGHLNIVKLLLEKKPDLIRMKSIEGSTSLHAASHFGHSEIVEFLIKKDRSLINDVSEGKTAFIMAVLNGHVNVVNVFLEKDPSLLSSDTQQGFNVLCKAIVGGNSEVVKILINKNPDLINMKIPETGVNAMHVACHCGNLEVVKILFEKCPDLTKQKAINSLNVPIEEAKNRGHQMIVDFLESSTNRFDSQPIERQFSALGIDSASPAKTKAPDPKDSSARKNSNDYWKFCREERWKELEALIKGDRDILFNHKHSEASMAMGGSTEKTLFHRIVESGATEALAILIQYSQPSQFNLKCNIGYKIGDGQSEGDEIRGITALYLAVDKQKKEMVKYLIENSNVDEIVTKNSKDSDKLVELSILENALKKLGSAEDFEILKIITGDNVAKKKARFFKYNEGDERRGEEIEKMARNFQKYGAEVKELLEQKYPDEIKIIKEEIEKKSKQPEAKVESPRANGGASASSSSQSFLNSL